MLNLQHSIWSSNDSDNIETDVKVDMTVLNKMVRSLLKVANLLIVYGIGRFHKQLVPTCLHLNEHTFLTILGLCNDIQVTVTGFPVTFHDSVAFPPQVFRSRVFTPFSQVVMLCHIS